MASEDTQTTSSTSSSAPTNPAVTATTNKLLGGINDAYDAGLKVNPVSLYGGVGDTTKQSWQQALNASANPDYANGVNGAISSFADTAAGKNIGVDAPGYQTIRNKLQNDVLTATNGAFNNSGLFGSDNNQTAAASGLTDSLGALDLQQYNNGIAQQQAAVPILQQLYAASQQPAATAGAVGAAKDADTQATLLGNNDLFRRTNDSQTDLLAKLSSILNGTAATSGNTTTQTNTSPAPNPWYAALGLGASLL
jgi:hypothetical protein